LIILSAYWGLHVGGQRDLKSVSFDGSWVEFKCIGQDLVDILTLLSALTHWWNVWWTCRQWASLDLARYQPPERLLGLQYV